jgi:Transglutaminase-like superfamily
MGIQDRDYMRRDGESASRAAGVHPSLRNLKFAKVGYGLIEKALLLLIATVITVAFMQGNLTCSKLNLVNLVSKNPVHTYKDIGTLANQLYFQPLIYLQSENSLNEFFSFLNIHKGNCLGFENVIFTLICWLVIGFLFLKSLVYLRFTFKFIVHRLLFDVIKLNPFSNINKVIFRNVYPVKSFKVETVFITFLFVGLSLVQFKSISFGNQSQSKDKVVKATGLKKNKQTDLVEFGGNYRNIYSSNINELKVLDDRVKNISSADTQNIFTLSKALTEGLTTDLEKIYVIYKWVTNNIEYDSESFFANNWRGIGNANTVIQRRKAVCDGYAELVMRLGLQSGLLIEKVEGYAKGYGYKMGEQLAAPNHAWNSVRVDGEWYLLDSTWDAGSINESTRSYERKNADYDFFLTNPQIFIYSHFAKEDKWNLAKNNWDKKEFFSRVNVSEGAFKLGLNIDKYSSAVIDADSLPYVLDYETDAGLYGAISANGSKIKGEWTFLKYDNNGRAKLLVSAPSNGSYNLQLYGNFKKQPGVLHSFLQYKINVNNSLNNFGVFPQTFPPYNSMKVVLDAPLNGVLVANNVVKFRLRANGVQKLVIYQNGKAIETMKEEGGIYTADLKVEKGDLMIYGDFNTANQLAGILKYQVN